MSADEPPELRRGLHRVAAGLVLPDLLDVAAAVGVAESLVAAGHHGPATVEAAGPC